MMYHQKLATAIKVNGRVLREVDGTVSLPFGSEYTILLKNLDSVRLMVRVEIDGTDTTEGTWLVIPANGSIELERFIKGGNWLEGNRFKFIARSAEVEAHRGVGVEDGLVRIEHQIELRQPAYMAPTIYYPPGVRGHRLGDRLTRQGNLGAGNSDSTGHPQASSVHVNSLTASFAVPDAAYEHVVPTAAASTGDPGITVAGSVSQQQFAAAESFQTTGEHFVSVFRLRGTVGEVPLEAPVTVLTKVACTSCGLVSPFGTRYCQRCGTGLILR